MPSRKAKENAHLYFIQAFETRTKPSTYVADGLVYYVYKIGTASSTITRLRKLSVDTNDTKMPTRRQTHIGGLRMVHGFANPVGIEAIRLEHWLQWVWTQWENRHLRGEWFYFLPEEVANMVLEIKHLYIDKDGFRNEISMEQLHIPDSG